MTVGKKASIAHPIANKKVILPDGIEANKKNLKNFIYAGFRWYNNQFSINILFIYRSSEILLENRSILRFSSH